MTAAATPATILVAFGTRSEAIRLVPAAAAPEADPRFRVSASVSAEHRATLDQPTADLLVGHGEVMDEINRVCRENRNSRAPRP